MIAPTETRKNSRLTQYDDIREAVVANAVKNVPALKREKAKGSNRSLAEF